MSKKEELETLNIKKVKLATNLAMASKETIAMALIGLGMKLLSEGHYLEGGALVTLGWILLVIQQVLTS